MTNKNKNAYLPYVDGMRALAVLAVLFYHVNPAWVPGGFSGVDIFFVISGFIVSASVGNLEPTSLWRFIPYFYARRLQRIAPALIACLLATTLLSVVFIPPAWLSNAHQQTGLYAFFGLSNFILAQTNNDYFSPTAEFNPFTHTWSLGVEEQFYFVFPFLFFAWTYRNSRRVTVGLFIVALVASFGYSAWASQANPTAGFYMITSRFWQLAAGVLLYQLMSLNGRRFDGTVQAAHRWAGVGTSVSVLLIGYGLVFSNPGSFPFPGAIPTVLGSLGLLGFLHGAGRENWLARGLTFAPVVFVGRISYSLYLWHWPVLVLFRWTVGDDTVGQRALIVALSFALAIASYYVIERPVRRARILHLMPRLAVVAIGLVCVFGSAWVAKGLSWRFEMFSVNTVAQHMAEWYPNSADPAPIAPGCTVQSTHEADVYTYERQGCSFASNAPTIFAIGDSHSMAYNALYREYAMQTGGRVVLIRNGGCAFLPFRVETDGCRANSAAGLADLLARIHPGDVVFMPSLRLPRFSDQWERHADEAVRDELFSVSAVEARAQAVARSRDVLNRIHSAGAFIVFEAPKPIFKSPPYRCANAFNRTNQICRDGSEVIRAELEELRKPILQVMTSFADELTRVSVWDPFPVLCPPGPKCSAYLDGHPLYFDGDHISGYANRMLVPSFSEFVGAAALPASETATDGSLTVFPPRARN